MTRRGESQDAGRLVRLPAPSLDGSASLEKAMRSRRSVREYARRPIAIAQLSQLLWAAQGTTTRDGLRTAPSAGALYPLEIDAVVGDVVDLPCGIYRYRSRNHELLLTAAGDRRTAIARAALEQYWMESASVLLVFSGVYERTTRRYGKRGVHYVHFEVGHAVENAALQAAALGLGTVVVGAFEDRAVAKILGLSPGEVPFVILPAGVLP